MLWRLDDVLKHVPGWQKLRGSARFRAFLGFEPTLWTRKVADREVRKLVSALEPPRLRVLEVSGRVWETEGFEAYRSVHFPDFDITRSRLPGSFDLVIAEHVFEHLLQPGYAGRNIYEMLSPGGAALVVTPFLYKIHNNPQDCWRWTESGLRQFLASCGFRAETIQTGSWGNRACVEATFRREYRLYNRYFHSLKHEPEFPIVVWALARR
jgi:SAM-dependent methyltransferase